jgi:hypothetical protein
MLRFVGMSFPRVEEFHAALHLRPVATGHDVGRLALAMPEATERTSRNGRLCGEGGLPLSRRHLGGGRTRAPAIPFVEALHEEVRDRA